jgi:hypothetical protein
MYKKLIFALLVICISSTSSHLLGQTKKIALRSHSGSHTNFTIAAPDEFGMVPPSRLKEYYRPIKIETLHARELSIQDTLVSCKPIPDSIYYPKVKLIHPRKSRQKKQPNLISDTSMIRAAAPSTEEVPSIVVSAIPPKPQKGSMNWIGILILLPIAFVFSNSIKV